MEKKKKSVSIDLPPSKLYYDDLEAIVQAFEDEGMQVELETDDYKLNALKELLDLNAPCLHEFTVKPKGQWFYCTVRFKKGLAYISDLSDAKSRGIAAKIVEIVEQRRKPRPAFIIYPASLGLIVGTSILSKENRLGIAFLLIVAIPLMLYGFHEWTKNYSVIIPRKRRDSQGFWERNREEFLKDAVKSAVSFAAGYLAAKFGLF